MPVLKERRQVQRKQNEVYFHFFCGVCLIQLRKNILFAEIQQKELQRTERQANGPPPDPSYDFAFRTPEYQRRENADNLGRVRGN